jgi:glycosyltransferase involved in cell wall biosynthesis
MRPLSSGMTSPNLTSSVVVCTRDRPEALEQCLPAIQRQDYPAFDVWVIDNAPRDHRARASAERHGVRYAVEPRPGVSRARNLAARCSTAEVLAYIDDDALPEPGWLAALAREFRDPQVMAVCGKVIPSSLNTDAERLYEAVHVRRDQRMEVSQETPRWVELTSCGGVGDGNMAFRRGAFLSWPGFDERLGLGSMLEGNEEHKALFELVAKGHRVIYTPEAVIRHPHPSTVESLRARYYKELSASRGYLMMLLVEYPQYRRDLFSYLMRGRSDARREWLAGRASSDTILPLGQRLRATLSGVSSYVRTRLEKRPRATAEAGPIAEKITVSSAK